MINLFFGLAFALASATHQPSFVNDSTMGVGIAKAHLSDGKKIYFFHLFPLHLAAYQIRPVDSIVIKKGKHHFEITYAPPWFYPEMMKLDYDMLMLRAVTISKSWMEVIVNKQTGQTTWVMNDDFEFNHWAEFLLKAYSIELIDLEKNPVRLKPLDYASILATAPERFQFKPLAIQGSWMMVETNGLADRIAPIGWIRWRKDDVLLIRFSLLS